MADLKWSKDKSDRLKIGWWIRSDGKVRIVPSFTAIGSQTYWVLHSVNEDGSTGGELGYRKLLGDAKSYGLKLARGD